MAWVAWGAGVVAGGTAVWLYNVRPRDPIFEVVAINLKGFNLRFCTDSPMLMAVVDVELILSIRVTNDNVAPIEYTSTIMDIFYRGHLLGQAQVKEGSQEAKSSKVLDVPCKLDGLEMTSHVRDLFKDVAKREMNLHSVVTIAGQARVWKWTHNFEVHVTSEIKVDPIFLSIIEQENKVELEIGSPMYQLNTYQFGVILDSGKYCRSVLISSESLPARSRKHAFLLPKTLEVLGIGEEHNEHNLHFCH